MCGICGIATRDPKRPIGRELILRMTDSLAHRGPDGEGVHVGPGIGIGVRRLAIVDLETGDQPIVNEDSSVVVVCNGEIYNHVELRQELIQGGHRFRTQSDVETIAHLYEDLGQECVHRLRGMFAFALWDAKHARLMLARDRLGIKPLAWAHTRDGLAFASEYKALLAGGLVEPALNPTAVDNLFGMGWAGIPHAMCAGVQRLPAGHVLLYEGDQVRLKRWWEPPFGVRQDQPGLSEGEWAEGLLERLEEAVRIHLRADVPVGAWLSAGIDSSTVAALAVRILGRTVDAFSLEFEDPEFDEVGTTKTLDHFPGYDLRPNRIRHTDGDFALLPRCIWHAEEQVGNGFGTLRQRLSEVTASRVKVALAGEGADEMLGGYPWYKADRRLRKISRLLAGRRRRLRRPPRTEVRERILRLARAPLGPGPERFQAVAGPLGSESRRRLYSPELARAIDQNPSPPLPVPASLEGCHPVEFLQYWDITTRMHEYILATLDHHSMAWSVEIRVPFLDHKVVEWCLAMPPRLKEARREKRVLRRAVAGLLPKEILKRRKRGLRGPSSRLYRGTLPPFAEELLAPETLRAKGWFDPGGFARIREMHRAGLADRSEHIQSVLTVQMWDELFLKGRSYQDFDLGPGV